jgi:hypothetical protein
MRALPTDLRINLGKSPATGHDVHEVDAQVGSAPRHASV